MEQITHTPKSLRARRGFSQLELAERSGVSDRTIRNLEDGLDVSLESVRALAAALDVEVPALIAAIDVERARRAAEGSAV